ncbi:MAG: CoxE [Acidobacteria bacterium]|nr:MAG: CoxE [Acidobacteriota bacterium]
MSRLLENLLIFGRVLRRAGIDVHPGRLLDVIEALEQVNLGARDDVYYTCRTLLVHRREQIPIFDRAFAAFWRAQSAAAVRDGSRPDRSRPSAVEIEDVLAPEVLASDELASMADAGDEERSAQTRDGVKIWSDAGGLANKDFAAFTGDELAAARAALSRLVWNPGERRTRRWVRGRGSRIDLRRAIGESLRTGGDIVKLARRTRRVHPRPLVLLCDVSGSMERYTRMLLHFAHAITWRHRRVEAFLFSTQLTRVSRQLRLPRADDAVAAVSRLVPDWSGGTRIGGAVKQFHQRWGRRVLNGGPVVLLISDGWDRGDPAELAEQVARLQRSCHRLVWLNPLIGTADYAPLTRGLQAALPFVDDFLPARTLTNLVDLAAHLNALG